MKRSVTLLLLAFAFAATARADAPGKIVFREDFAGPLSAEWKPFKFSGQTDYRTGLDGTNQCLIAHAKAAASGIAHAVTAKAEGKLMLHWRWKINHCPPGATETNLATFDHTVRVFVAFKTFIGPPRSVHYVWANQEKIGAPFLHPNSGRARFIALQTGNARAGEWVTESRDVTADWRKLFPDQKLPEATAVGVITGTDSTGTDVTGWYADIELRAEP